MMEISELKQITVVEPSTVFEGVIDDTNRKAYLGRLENDRYFITRFLRPKDADERQWHCETFGSLCTYNECRELYGITVTKMIY